MKEVDWDESTRHLLALARQESVALGDGYIGTQHLLLAAVAVTPIERHGIGVLNREEVLAAIVHCVGVRNDDVFLLSPGGQTPRTKLVITHAWERANNESRQINCRDIWFGLLADSESDVQKVIQYLGLRSEAMRRLT